MMKLQESMGLFVGCCCPLLAVDGLTFSVEYGSMAARRSPRTIRTMTAKQTYVFIERMYLSQSWASAYLRPS